MRAHSHLNTSFKIIEQYDGSTPLAHWLKEFFRKDKKFGSRDRKAISHACYCWFRLGHSFTDLPGEERLLLALFLCSAGSNPILEALRPDWNAMVTLPLSEKIKSVGGEVSNIFPFVSDLSDAIQLQAFQLSFLQQPFLFLRSRKNSEAKVAAALTANGIAHDWIDEDTVQLENQSKLEDLLAIDEDVVVQDLNSQKTISPLQPYLDAANSYEVWDCCAASGGKSILFHDHYPAARLTVSDVRESIIANLKKRFARAKISGYRALVADLSAGAMPQPGPFDIIICDAPCSGSGTWSRTPEQLRFFKKDRIDSYAALQYAIAKHAATNLKKGGWFLYITCSVFKKENEAVVHQLEQTTGLQLVAAQYFEGYTKRADTLFTALFRL